MIVRFATSSPSCSRRRATAVDQAADGDEALRRLDAGGYDIVLLDIGLPDVSGLDVLAHARAAASPPIVIMMTADDTPETLLVAVRRQAYRYLRKPFAPSAIVEVVEEAIEQGSVRGDVDRGRVGAARVGRAGRAVRRWRWRTAFSSS